MSLALSADFGGAKTEANLACAQPAVVEALGKMGHEVGMMSGSGRGMFGRGQIIQRKSDPVTGQLVWAAGSDPRGDGHATAQL